MFWTPDWMPCNGYYFPKDGERQQWHQEVTFYWGREETFLLAIKTQEETALNILVIGSQFSLEKGWFQTFSQVQRMGKR